MAPWAQIAKPFSLYLAVNCFKTVIGAGFVGYGVALALLPLDDCDEDGDENDVGKSDGAEAEADAFGDGSKAEKQPTNGNNSNSKNNDGPTAKLVRKYVAVATTIGFGLFLSLPSLASQIVWETFIPGIVASDIAHDVATENVMGILPKWNLKKPDLSSLVPSKEKIVGGLAEAMAENSARK